MAVTDKFYNVLIQVEDIYNSKLRERRNFNLSQDCTMDKVAAYDHASHYRYIYDCSL